MKKNIFIAILSCILLTSCEGNYPVTYEYYLDNQTSEPIYMTYRCNGMSTESSVYEISPYEKMHLDILDQYSNKSGSKTMSYGGRIFESMTLKYKDNTYVFIWDLSAEDAKNNPTITTSYTDTPNFIGRSLEDANVHYNLFSLTDEFFEESEEYIVDFKHKIMKYTNRPMR